MDTIPDFSTSLPVLLDKAHESRGSFMADLSCRRRSKRAFAVSFPLVFLGQAASKSSWFTFGGLGELEGLLFEGPQFGALGRLEHLGFTAVERCALRKPLHW